MMDTMIFDRSWVEIDLAAFRHNLRQLKSLLPAGVGFMQIVKADAYGHGALEIGRIAIDEGARFLGVANLEEGKLLRIQGCKAPILILSPSLENEIEQIINYDLQPCVSQLSFALALQNEALKHGKCINIHLKLDSGMHRSGVEPEQFEELYHEVKKLSQIRIEGVCSHFASSEEDPEFSNEQIRHFESMLRKMEPQPEIIHIANSSAVVNRLLGVSNMARLGILSFGVYTNESQKEVIELKTVMSFKSRIAQIKHIKAGEGLGYNLSWIASKDSRYAVVPVGYADGYDFMLSNKAKVSIRSQLCDVIGKVSMDMICVDISQLPDAKLMDEVVLMGAAEQLQPEQLSKLYHGSSYELLCQVGRRAKRYYLENDAVSHSTPLARRDFVSSDFSDLKLSQIIQSAISQRLQNEEMGELISREILKYFFFNKDQDIHYRKDFFYDIRLKACKQENHWQATMKLNFKKVLQNDYFIVACANNAQALNRYFIKRDVEYRWLLDNSITLSEEYFHLTQVYVNDLLLDTSLKLTDSCIEIRCEHPQLKNLVGKEVAFSIEVQSFYPKAAHQFSVYINELTHGVKVKLSYPDEIRNMEIVPIFSGQNRFPRVEHSPGCVTVQTAPDQWTFPISGIVFAY